MRPTRRGFALARSGMVCPPHRLLWELRTRMASAFRDISPSDNRRRRLMSVDDGQSTESLLLEYGIRLPEPERERPADQQPTDWMVTRLISRRLWKHLLLIIPLLTFLAVWPAVFRWSETGTHSVQEAAARSTVGSVSEGSAFTSRLDLSSTQDGSSIAHGQSRGLMSVNPWRVAEGASGGLLLLSAQLSILIYLLRTQSAVDFHGGYRVWSWLAVFLGGISTALLSGFFWTIPDFLATQLQSVAGPLNAAKLALALVPLTAGGIVIAWRLLPDMSDCRTSQVLFSGAILLMTVLLLNSTGRFVLFDRTEDSAATLMLLSGLVFSSCLLHARHVIYVSLDPPRRSTGRVSRSGTVKASSANTDTVTAGCQESQQRDAACTDTTPTVAPSDASALTVASAESAETVDFGPSAAEPATGGKRAADGRRKAKKSAMKKAG